MIRKLTHIDTAFTLSLLTEPETKKWLKENRKINYTTKVKEIAKIRDYFMNANNKEEILEQLNSLYANKSEA